MGTWTWDLALGPRRVGRTTRSALAGSLLVWVRRQVHDVRESLPPNERGSWTPCGQFAKGCNTTSRAASIIVCGGPTAPCTGWRGRGEPVRDPGSGTDRGALGVTINVDRRHSRLEAETARESAERVSVGRSCGSPRSRPSSRAWSVAEVGDVIVRTASAALHAARATSPRSMSKPHELVMPAAQSGYPDWVVRDDRWGRSRCGPARGPT